MLGCPSALQGMAVDGTASTASQVSLKVCSFSLFSVYFRSVLKNKQTKPTNQQEPSFKPKLPVGSMQPPG